MKNQAEIYQALLNGEVLSHCRGVKAKLINGEFNVSYGAGWSTGDLSFFDPGEWSIETKEPEWYEQDLSAGVLCRVKDKDNEKWSVEVIKSYQPESIYRFRGATRCGFNIAEPLDLTKPLMVQLEAINE